MLTRLLPPDHLDRLQCTRRQLDSPLARADACQDIDELLLEIGELQQAIDTAPVEPLADAAVKLRRLSAHLALGHAARLLASALVAVERSVEPLYTRQS